MTEPEYLAQYGEFDKLNWQERSEWFRARIRDGKKKGVNHVRASVDNHDNPTMALVEGWIKQPKEDGPVRWQLTHAEETKP